MSLDSSQVQPNSRVNVGGSDGIIFSTDPHLTYVTREDGEVNIYTTESVVENGEPVLSQEEQEAANEQSDKDARIADLEAQLAAAKGATGEGQTPAVDPSQRQQTP